MKEPYRKSVSKSRRSNLEVTYPEETSERALGLIVFRSVAVLLSPVDRRDPARLVGLLTRQSLVEAYGSEAKGMLREDQS